MIHAIYLDLIELIHRDPDLMGVQIPNNKQCYSIAEGACQFSIRGLFESYSNEGMSYFHFRKHLLNSNLNQLLRDSGYKIEIAESTGNVDSNKYQMIQLKDAFMGR